LCDIVPSAVAVDAHGDRIDAHGDRQPNDAFISKPEIILSDYGKITEKYIESSKDKYKSLTVDTYVIMPNHIHLILSLCNDDLICKEKPCHDVIPKYVSSLKTLITKEIGFSLFQRNFYDRIIRSEDEYEKIWQYIELNPTTWAEDCFYI
jgi:REP element-mobilizing transposase RayT